MSAVVGELKLFVFFIRNCGSRWEIKFRCVCSLSRSRALYLFLSPAAPEQPVKQQEMAALDADGSQSDFLQSAAGAAASDQVFPRAPVLVLCVLMNR